MLVQLKRMAIMFRQACGAGSLAEQARFKSTILKAHRSLLQISSKQVEHFQEHKAQ